MPSLGSSTYKWSHFLDREEFEFCWVCFYLNKVWEANLQSGNKWQIVSWIEVFSECVKVYSNSYKDNCKYVKQYDCFLVFKRSQQLIFHFAKIFFLVSLANFLSCNADWFISRTLSFCSQAAIPMVPGSITSIAKYLKKKQKHTTAACRKTNYCQNSAH